MWGRNPAFPLVTSVNNDATGTLSRFCIAINLSYLPPSSLLPFNHRLASVLESLRRITAAITSPDLGLADREAVSNQIYLAEFFLLSSDVSLPLPSAISLATFSFGVNLDLSFRITALLYLHIIIREIPPTAKMHHNPISNLASVLESFSPFLPDLGDPDSQSSQLELLAWMMFIGALAAEERAERSVFVGTLSTICATLFITTREDLQSRLQRIMWRADLCDGFLEGLWGELFVDSLRI
jgi:Fungal specific transcription factor domain